MENFDHPKVPTPFPPTIFTACTTKNRSFDDRHTMAAEPLAAPLHISVTPWLIVTKLEESIV
jgi:hypothetical protein